MIVEEWGLALEHPNPYKAAITTFLAFVTVGLLPISVYFYNFFASDAYELQPAFTYSILVTGVGFFFIGGVKGKIVQRKWWFSGLETLLVGSVAAALSYFIGHWLAHIVK